MNVRNILIILILIGGVGGWGLNIYKLIETNFEAPYKAEIIRSVGVIIVPVGSFFGWINIDDKKKLDEQDK